MNNKIIFLFMILIFISSVCAIDFENGVVVHDDNYIYGVNAPFSVDQFTVKPEDIYFNNISFCNSAYKTYFDTLRVCPSTTGGGGGSLFYDVLVDLEREVYTQREDVVAKITIINQGDVPDNDAVLIYYFTDSEGNNFKEVREQIFEFPVGKKVIGRELTLSKEAVIGEWKFNVIYDTVQQSDIKVHRTFQVVDYISWFDRAYIWISEEWNNLFDDKLTITEDYKNIIKEDNEILDINIFRNPYIIAIVLTLVISAILLYMGVPFWFVIILIVGVWFALIKLVLK